MRGGTTGEQCGNLLFGSCLPHGVQQFGDGTWIVEGSVGGGAPGQRPGLFCRARLPQET